MNMDDQEATPTTVSITSLEVNLGATQYPAEGGFMATRHTGAATVTLTGTRPWGEVTVRATASESAAAVSQAMAGWQALLRLMGVADGVTEEEWDHRDGRWQLEGLAGRSPEVAP